MSNLSPQQFASVPLEHVHGFPLDTPDSTWEEEHAHEYAQHGGWQGYVSHLATDMKKRGQREPVELRHEIFEGKDHYTINDGNHRVAAARVAGLTHVNALVEQAYGSSRPSTR